MDDFQSKNHALETFSGLKDTQKNSNWFLGIGIALIILGGIAIAASPFVTLASMLIFGAILIAGGVIQAINAFKTRHGQGFFLNLLGGVFYSIVGILLILHPELGAITLTLLLAVFYSVSGLFKIGAALAHRYAHWGWVLLSGFISLALGILIWAQWPISGLFIIGLFIGIDMMMAGWVWVALALDAKRTKSIPK